jgi:hypothetical protein
MNKLAALLIVMFALSAYGQVEKERTINAPQFPSDLASIAAIAEQVHVGKLPCELGQWVKLEADPKSPTHFYLEFKNERYHLTPVKTSTGAIRLEDELNGAVWIQLSNKSMLMNTKLGRRQADECKSPGQFAVSEAMKLAPPINILEPAPEFARK